jgi:TrmH family RNA methyltransferase
VSRIAAVDATALPYNHHMFSTAQRDHLAIVLVGARNPSNIGAAARAMQDFGFSDLRIVNDYAAPFEAAHLEDAALPKSAVAAASVMQRARRFTTLADAIADCTLIVATTAIGDRDLARPVLTLQQAAPEILVHLSATHLPETGEDDTAHQSTSSTPGPARIALLFGSEKTGLTNDQLSHAQILITIPMFAPEQARHLSMNLGQSVAVCLYELTREGFEQAKEIPIVHEAPATAEDRERLTQLLLDVMHVTEYSRRFPANATEPLVRQLSRHLGTSHRESMTWMGILRQVLWRTSKQ